MIAIDEMSVWQLGTERALESPITSTKMEDWGTKYTVNGMREITWEGDF